MGFNNPAMPWKELERRLSDRHSERTDRSHGGPKRNYVSNDVPIEKFSRPQETQRTETVVPYAELHTHSHFSFLDGASSPEELVLEAVRLDLEALALTDHGGLYGVVRFAECAREVGLPTVFGAEITVDARQPGESSTRATKDGGSSRAGSVDPAGKRLIVLARHPEGYGSLSTLLSQSQMAGKKNDPCISTVELLAALDSHRGDWAVLTAGRRGGVPFALETEGLTEARKELCQIVEETIRLYEDEGRPLPPVTSGYDWANTIGNTATNS